MNPTELNCKSLMIGDLVSYNGTPIKVENIHGDCINYSPDIPYVQEEFFIDIADVKPIPLTPEILRKNGFTHCLTAPCGYYHAPTYDMFDILFHISEDTYEDTWHTEVFTDHNDNNFVLFNLCYVHELQHALRLCGLNELADNFRLEK